MRVVSLDTALTDHLALLGRTHHLVHPPHQPPAPDDLPRLAFDLILTQSTSAAPPALHLPPGARHVHLCTTTFEGMLDALLAIGEALGAAREALVASTALRNRTYGALEYVNQFSSTLCVACLIDLNDPHAPVVAGHWVPQLIERAGATHPLNPTQPVPGAGAAAGPIGLTQRTAPAPVAVPVPILLASRPDVLLLAPRARTFAQARDDAHRFLRAPAWADAPAARPARVVLLDGAALHPPGPRLVDALELFVALLHDRPDLAPHPQGPACAWAALHA
jgi:iron complex transport system substrate-binding protein